MSTSLPGTEQPGDHPPPRQISGWLSTEPNVSHYCKGRGSDQCCILHPGGTPASDNADGHLHITRCTRSVCRCESCRPSYLAARVAEAQCQHHHKTSYRCGQVGFGIQFSRLLYYPVTPFALNLREWRIVERGFDRNMHALLFCKRPPSRWAIRRYENRQQKVPSLKYSHLLRRTVPQVRESHLATILISTREHCSDHASPTCVPPWWSAGTVR